TRPPPFAEARLLVSEGPHARFVGPWASGLYPDRRTSGELETSVGTILLDGLGGVRVRIRPDPATGRVSYAWVAGRLVALFWERVVGRAAAGDERARRHRRRVRPASDSISRRDFRRKRVRDAEFRSFPKMDRSPHCGCSHVARVRSVGLAT